MNVHVELVMIAKLGATRTAIIIFLGKKQWKQLIKDAKNLLKLMSL